MPQVSPNRPPRNARHSLKARVIEQFKITLRQTDTTLDMLSIKGNAPTDIRKHLAVQDHAGELRGRGVWHRVGAEGVSHVCSHHRPLGTALGNPPSTAAPSLSVLTSPLVSHCPEHFQLQGPHKP